MKRSTRKPAVDAEELVAVVNALRRVVRAIRVSSHEAETSVGITGAQLFVLQQLAEHPGASLGELAALTLTDQSSVSVVVSRLVRRRLVTRRTSSADRRRVELSLTAQGRARLNDAPELAQAQLMRSLRGVPPADLAVMRAVLDRLVRDLGAGGVPAEMFFENRPR